MAEVTASVLDELYKAAYEAATDDEFDELIGKYCQLVNSLPTVYVGPTWSRNEQGKWALPEHTLGWQIAGWCSEFVGGPGGKPWKFTKEQLRFILWWYAVDDNGYFLYRTGVLQRCKGWGKDPLLAVLCLVEFVGPSRFSHWDDYGNPVGKQCPDAWVQIAAVSKTQTKNTVRLFPSFITKHMAQTYGIKPGAELWRADEGRRFMETVTSNPATIEGGRSTFVVLNETHHWRSGNQGIDMYDTIEGNITKMRGRYLAITNAYMPHEKSVAQKMREAWQEIQDGKKFDVGVLYDSVEADERAPLTAEAMEIILPKVRGDSWWLSVKDTIQSALFGARSPSKSRRMYYNQIVSAEDAIYKDGDWRACLNRDLELAMRDTVVLGFDGGKTNDATALVALRVKDMFTKTLGVWEKPTGPEGENWQVDRRAVDSKVHEAFRKYNVVGFYADVAEWTSYIDTWHELYGEGLVVKAVAAGNAIAWDMRQGGAKPTLAHMRLVEAIKTDKAIRHNGDPDLRRHVLNARERWNNHGMSFGKEGDGSDKKVDAYAALVLAYECLHDYRTRRKTETKTEGSPVWFL